MFTNFMCTVRKACTSSLEKNPFELNGKTPQRELPLFGNLFSCRPENKGLREFTFTIVAASLYTLVCLSAIGTRHSRK